MLAFHNKQEIKDEYLARVRAHAAADEIIKGQYWQGGRGCAVGCTIHSAVHKDYEDLLGIPVRLAYLEDRLFENLPLEKAKLWPELFLSSIEVGADLSLVFSKFIVRVLGDSERGCIIHAKTPGAKAAIETVISLYERKITGNAASSEEWELARHCVFVNSDGATDEYSTARAAAAANAATYAGDVYPSHVAHACAAGVEAASDSAAAAARSATHNTVATSPGVERVRHYEWMADVLIEELKNASVP